MTHLRRSSSLFFIPPEPYPARFARHLPHAGKALSVVILFLHVSCIRFDDARKAASSYRSLPHWGRGTASAVDRVLSYTDRLRRSPPLFFIMPPAPYPARCTRCFPHGGRLGIWERGRTTKKTNRNGSPFLVVRLACVSEVAGRYRAKARKRAGLERCDRVSCGIQFISRG